MKIIRSSTRMSGQDVITTLPPEVLKKLNLDTGNEIEYLIKENSIEIRKADRNPDTDFLELVDKVMDDYNQSLKSLVER